MHSKQISQCLSLAVVEFLLVSQSYGAALPDQASSSGYGSVASGNSAGMSSDYGASSSYPSKMASSGGYGTSSSYPSKMGGMSSSMDDSIVDAQDPEWQAIMQSLGSYDTTNKAAKNSGSNYGSQSYDDEDTMDPMDDSQPASYGSDYDIDQALSQLASGNYDDLPQSSSAGGYGDSSDASYGDYEDDAYGQQQGQGVTSDELEKILEQLQGTGSNWDDNYSANYADDY